MFERVATLSNLFGGGAGRVCGLIEDQSKSGVSLLSYSPRSSPPSFTHPCCVATQVASEATVAAGNSVGVNTSEIVASANNALGLSPSLADFVIKRNMAPITCIYEETNQASWMMQSYPKI
jgi:hypothetical protein